MGSVEPREAFAGVGEEVSTPACSAGELTLSVLGEQGLLVSFELDGKGGTGGTRDAFLLSWAFVCCLIRRSKDAA
jgi:hypothetical protein